MRVYLTTSINKTPVVIYDTGDMSGPGLATRLLSPHVTVKTDDGTEVYSWGGIPPDYRPYLMAAGILALVGGVALAKRWIKKK
jgi:hypothetical protein